MGPELLRVKDLARRSNSFDEADYTEAMKVLKRIDLRKQQGIVIHRHGAGKEIVPSSKRQVSVPLAEGEGSSSVVPDDTGVLMVSSENELSQGSLCRGRALFAGHADSPYAVEDLELIDLQRVMLPINYRYSLLAYGDASFAVGDLKQSVTGYVVYLNGTPLLWGSLKQTIVVDSSCSAEFVAASVTCKQLLHAENMLGFLDFSCPKPYRLYTDSMACYHIATNPSKLGNVRHLQIRFHLVRCYVSFGDVKMYFCVTEEMVADLLTKMVASAQDQRLSLRFYSLYPDSGSIVMGFSSDGFPQ
jgi:hypothetical protein